MESAEVSRIGDWLNVHLLKAYHVFAEDRAGSFLTLKVCTLHPTPE